MSAVPGSRVERHGMNIPPHTGHGHDERGQGGPRARLMLEDLRPGFTGPKHRTYTISLLCLRMDVTILMFQD